MEAPPSNAVYCLSLFLVPPAIEPKTFDSLSICATWSLSLTSCLVTQQCVYYETNPALALVLASVSPKLRCIFWYISQKPK